MRALVQRVSQASVSVEEKVIGEIRQGLLILIGIRKDDDEARAAKLAKKITNLRVFPDSKGKMNLSVRDISGGMLIVSQFTLYGDTASGNRPSYSEAAEPVVAEKLYEIFVQFCKDQGVTVATGTFRAHMQVSLINDGPVTLMCCVET